MPATAIKVFKTSAWPEPADCMGQAALKGYLGRKSHVAQLNAAGKHMAALHGWEVRSRHPPSLCWACTALRPHWALQAQTRPWHTMHALHVCCESSWPLCEAESVSCMAHKPSRDGMHGPWAESWGPGGRPCNLSGQISCMS